MKRALTLAALLVPALLQAEPRSESTTFVHGRISQSFSGGYEIYEPFLRIGQHVRYFGGGASFSGYPLSGSLHATGSYVTVFGSWVDASASEFGGSWRVSATVRPQDGRQPARRLWFTLQSRGGADPKERPSYSVWEQGVNVNLRPSGDRDYEMTGWVDKDRFGAEGAALIGLLATAAMEARGQSAKSPRLHVQRLLEAPVDF